MNPGELKTRTKDFALRVIQLVGTLPKTQASDVLGRQLLRCATAVGANYRAACRARSRSEFVSRISIVEEEADEVAYWLEMLSGAGLADGGAIPGLLAEANQLTAIFTASGRTAKRNHKRTPLNPQSAIRNPK